MSVARRPCPAGCGYDVAEGAVKCSYCGADLREYEAGRKVPVREAVGRRKKLGVVQYGYAVVGVILAVVGIIVANGSFLVGMVLILLGLVGLVLFGMSFFRNPTV